MHDTKTTYNDIFMAKWLSSPYRSPFNQSLLPILSSFFRTQIIVLGSRQFGEWTKGQMSMICSLGRQHCFGGKYSIHKGHITQHLQKILLFLLTFLNVLSNLSTSLNLCVLCFSVFFRFTEMCRYFIVFTLSTIRIQWEHALWHQCWIFFFDQIRHTPY